MLLILSDAFDAHADCVAAKLQTAGLAYFRLNLDVESLRQTKMTFNGEKWRLATPFSTAHSGEFSCVWLRKYFVELTAQAQQGVDFSIFRNEFNATLLGFYAHIKSLAWLNPISNAVKGDNKYYQMQLAARLGLKMPRTFVSNDKSALIDFARACGDDVIFKLLNQQLHPIGDDGVMRGIYANRINSRRLAAFGESGENPILLQEYIQKAYEVRYTVVGKCHLACKIESQKSRLACEDWRRYDLARTPHSPITPPPHIARKVNELLAEMGLEYGALDFIVTPSGEWIFLEINCSGQWLWIEHLGGLDISGAIVEWIARRCK